jgi:hypothetical protein
VNDTTVELLEDVELSYKLFEFSVRTMCYAELDEINVEVFGRDLQLNLEEENVSFRDDLFKNNDEIVKASQMAVSTAFGATAICLDCSLEYRKGLGENLTILKALIQAVRNAFSHGIAAPCWYVKPHKREILDLAFINGPVINLEELDGQPFNYSQLGGLAVWFRIKDYVVKQVSST